MQVLILPVCPCWNPSPFSRIEKRLEKFFFKRWCLSFCLKKREKNRKGSNNRVALNVFIFTSPIFKHKNHRRSKRPSNPTKTVNEKSAAVCSSTKQTLIASYLKFLNLLHPLISRWQEELWGFESWNKKTNRHCKVGFIRAIYSNFGWNADRWW